MRRPGKTSGKAVQRRKTVRRRNAPKAGRKLPAADADEKIKQLEATSEMQLRADFEDALADHIWRTALAESDLQSAYDYWNLWRDNYLFNSWAFAILFFSLLVSFLSAIGVGFLWHGSELLSSQNVDTGAALQRVAIIGTIVALIVWMLHQLLRMWAYFEDMRNDAIERIGLLPAFAVLKGANWLTEADVAVALTALFRSRRSNIEAPAAPAASFDAVGKHAGEAAKRAKGG
jgi:hypothetical protein